MTENISTKMNVTIRTKMTVTIRTNLTVIWYTTVTIGTSFFLLDSTDIGIQTPDIRDGHVFLLSDFVKGFQF